MALPLERTTFSRVAVSAQTTCKGTAASSRRSIGRCCSSTRRMPVLGATEGDRPVRTRTSVSGRRGRISARPTVVHSASSRPSAAFGSAASIAPLSAPDDVPVITSGAIPAASSARSIPTWIDPSAAPPANTNAVVPGRRRAAMSVRFPPMRVL